MTEPAEVYWELRHRPKWLITMPPIHPPIARPCMAAPMTIPTRLARQVTGRTAPRDCCEHHRMDWHQVSAAAVPLARRLNREHITDADELHDRISDLTRGLNGDYGRAVRSLLSPDEGIMLNRDVWPPRQWTFANGRKRTYAMLEAGVHRTVTVEWVEVLPR